MTITSTTLNRLSNTPIATPWAMPTALPVYCWRSIERIRSIAWLPRSRTLTCSSPWSSSQFCKRSIRTSAGVLPPPAGVLNSSSTMLETELTWSATTVAMITAALASAIANSP